MHQISLMKQLLLFPLWDKRRMNKSSGNHHDGQALQGFGSHIQMLEPEVKPLIWFEETNSNHHFPSCSLKNIFFSTWIQCCYTCGFLVDWNFWKAPRNFLEFLCLVFVFWFVWGSFNIFTHSEISSVFLYALFCLKAGTITCRNLFFFAFLSRKEVWVPLNLFSNEVSECPTGH